MKQKILIILLIAIGFTSCKNRFTTGSYESRKFDHQSVAVIPPVSIYTGKVPDELTEEQLQMIEDEEALRFQDIVHSRLIFESGSRRRDVRIDFLSPAIVNEKLKAAGLSVSEAAVANPSRLGEILGVDVIVRGHLKMNRFMSDLESMKIEAVEAVVRNILWAAKVPVGLPGGTQNINRTYYIESGTEIVDAKDGVVVWKINSARNADWNYQPEQAIASMANQFADNFPYRNREFK